MNGGNFNSRRGSALLVVLGMLSFMLFSGLAFSVYMRYSRLPTSFVRRTSTTRQLAKAALAEAIDEIDLAIGNDPHPGVSARNAANDSIQNVWSHRVFIGEGTSSASSSGEGDKKYVEKASGGLYPSLVSQSATVPTLTLEGLAYLPPNLINEVRYYSRLTPTAAWHTFWFDSGRYAYTAVDVSDYFDVNRISADKPRASGGSQRLSLAHLFEGDNHESAGKGADEWNKIFGGRNPEEDPLVTLADFNLTWGSTTVGGMTSPFYRFVDGNGKSPYDCGSDPDDPKAEPYRGATFVTESYAAATKKSSGNSSSGDSDDLPEQRDLAEYQPFKDGELNGSTPPKLITGVMACQSEIVNSESDHADLRDHLCALGLVQLWDYLDVNHVPVSLAVPTLERVPMIVGIQPTAPTVELKCSRDGEDAPVGGDATTATRYTRTEHYYIKPSQQAAANVLAVYPFLNHGLNDPVDSFKVDGRLGLFMSTDEMTMRPSGAGDGLRLKKNTISKTEMLDNSVIAYALKAGNLSAKQIATNLEQPLKKVSLMPSGGSPGQCEVVTVTYEWEKKQMDSDGNLTDIPGHANPIPSEQWTTITAFTPKMRPLDRNGTPITDDKMRSLWTQANATVRFNAAVWARVSCSDPDMGEKTVDLVPASVRDDDELNGAGNADTMSLTLFGNGTPLLCFALQSGESGVNIPFTSEAFRNSASYELKAEQSKIFVSDPRYNHLPENWYCPGSSGDIAESDWMTEVKNMLGGDRDSDIYMATSDQGEMQSKYELAFLPRLTGLTKQTMGDSRVGNYPKAFSEQTKFVDKADSVRDASVMWKTYRCYSTASHTADPFDEINIVSGETSPKVNPYTDSDAVMMAALANTPHDWRVAYSNNEDVADMKASAFNAKHAWNLYSSDENGKLCWDCLQDFADKFKEAVREKGDWEDAYIGLTWGGDTRHLLSDIELEDGEDSDLHEIDKKFLCGFWHDCFGIKQQLFLIFVRAEPMMMGGGVNGQTPPQLGARAVAVVWRDPTATSYRSNTADDGQQKPNPHKTRILFYHQFD